MTGIGVRFALIALIVFPLCSLATHRLAERRHRAEAERHTVATSWRDRLLRESILTEYGWLPTETATRAVDGALASRGAAFILLDSEGRTVRASERLLGEGSSLFHLGSQEHATVPPLGRVEVTATPVRLFGQDQGTFLLLSSGPAARLPLGSAPPASDRAAARLPGFGSLLLGTILASLCLWCAAQLLVTRRVRAMTALAVGTTELRPGRKFAAGGSDELRALGTALNGMRRRTQRLVASMTTRESRRRDWLSELSHDLRTPLAALRLRLHNAALAATEAELREAVGTAVADCERVQALASGFMDLAELEVTEDFELEPVMPEELVGQVVRGLRPIAEAAGVELVTSLEPQETILADGHRLLRGLENVLRNAIRHARQRVTVGVARDADHISFWVEDDGAGFMELDRDESTDYRSWRGRGQAGGLGLRVTDRVARMHGGSLRLCNNGRRTRAVISVEAQGGVE